jgi:hypothetical protein
MVSPVLCTQFNQKGMPSESKLSKSIDISSGGVKLKSAFPVPANERLEITMALGPNFITFKGEVVHARPAEDYGYVLGIAITEIENHDRVVLTRFVIRKCREKNWSRHISRLQNGRKQKGLARNIHEA